MFNPPWEVSHLCLDFLFEQWGIEKSAGAGRLAKRSAFVLLARDVTLAFRGGVPEKGNDGDEGGFH